jgi:type I restriction enzyme S subunit
MPVNIGDNRVDSADIAMVGAADIERLSRYLVQPGDIVYSRRGDVRRRALICEKQAGWLCGTGCLRVRPGEGVLDAGYLSYYLGHSEVQDWIERHAIGATMPNLNTDILGALPVVVPPLVEQRAIASILGSLDDKIELNRRMSSTLDEIAQTIFASWFLHGDWSVCSPTGTSVRLGELVEMVKGRSYTSAELAPSDTALVTLKSFARHGGYRADGLKPYVGGFKTEQVIQPGEIAVALTDLTQAADVVGSPVIVLPSARYRRLVASLDTAVVRPLGDFPTSFVYFVMRTRAFKKHAVAHTTGTTVLHLNQQHLLEFLLGAVGQEEAERFASIADPILSRIRLCEVQSSTLAELRQTLLPGLISGQLSVLAAEAIAEEVV